MTMWIVRLACAWGWHAWRDADPFAAVVYGHSPEQYCGYCTARRLYAPQP